MSDDITIDFINQNITVDFVTQNITVDFVTNDITVDFATSAALSLVSFSYTGSDCSGSDGQSNRTLSFLGALLIAVDNQFLQPNINYTNTGLLITFLQPIWNSQNITIWK